MHTYIVHTHSHTHTDIRTYTLPHIHTHVHTYRHTCVHTHTYIHTYIDKKVQILILYVSARGRLRMTTHPTDQTLKDLLPTIEGGCSGTTDTVKCFAAGT